MSEGNHLGRLSRETVDETEWEVVQQDPPRTMPVRRAGLWHVTNAGRGRVELGNEGLSKPSSHTIVECDSIDELLPSRRGYDNPQEPSRESSAALPR
jgi:hypothetical protein